VLALEKNNGAGGDLRFRNQKKPPVYERIFHRGSSAIIVFFDPAEP
jgi:hypothetical protein